MLPSSLLFGMASILFMQLQHCPAGSSYLFASDLTIHRNVQCRVQGDKISPGGDLTVSKVAWRRSKPIDNASRRRRQ